MTISDGPPAIHQLWQDAFNRGDGEALVALYASDAVVLPPGADMAKGIIEVAPLMTAHIGAGLVTSITPTETKEFGDCAWQIGTWRLTSSTGQLIDHGKFLQIWRREEQGWRIARDIWNSSTAVGAAE